MCVSPRKEVPYRHLPYSKDYSSRMDLSGHPRFLRPTEEAMDGPARPTWTGEDRRRREIACIGQALLASAWQALAASEAEAVDIHLKGGSVIAGAFALRLHGAVAEASTRRGLWTHAFAADEVVLVQHIPRGGRRR